MAAACALNVETTESAGGTTTRARRPAAEPLRPYLDRGLLGFEQSSPPDRLQVWPSPTVTLMLQLSDPFRSMPRVFMSGLSVQPSAAEPAGAIRCIDLKLTPIGAHALFGIPMHQVAGLVVDFGHLVGEGHADRLVEQVAEADSWQHRLQAVEDLLLKRAAAAATHPDPRVTWCWDELRRTGGRVPIVRLAGATGWSHRHLIHRFREQVGVAPKTAARIVRFHRTVGVLQKRMDQPLAQTAVQCGYYDQAHLARELRALTGLTPVELAGSRPS